MQLRHLALVAPTIFGSSAQGDESRSALEGLVVPALVQVEKETAPSNPFAALTLPDSDRVSSNSPVTTVPVLLPDVGFRKVSKGEPVFQGPDRWSKNEGQEVIERISGTSLSSEVLRERYKMCYFHPRAEDTEGQVSYERLLTKTEIFLELAIYSGLHDDEIATLAGWIRGRGEFGERDLSKLVPREEAVSSDELSGWLGLYERVQSSFERKIREHVEDISFDDEAVREAVIQSLVVLELYDKAKDLHVLERGEMTDNERRTQVVPFLGKAAYFSLVGEDERDYKAALKQIELYSKKLSDLHDKEYEKGLSKSDLKNRVKFEEKLASSEQAKREIEDRIGAYQDEFGLTVGPNFIDHLPLDDLRKDLGARWPEQERR
ncbi:MAG: hypothetical protein KDD55_09585 [Bdellovibrionales bacterium]|nr:hypothetical protein [Bdellovibrionales bacterium]